MPASGFSQKKEKKIQFNLLKTLSIQQNSLPHIQMEKGLLYLHDYMVIFISLAIKPKQPLLDFKKSVSSEQAILLIFWLTTFNL